MNLQRLLYPKIPLKLLPTILGYAALGAIVAGVYGIVHDQVTFSISPEYFTRLKFLQFRYADFGFQPRFFVAEVGFLATWWVGFIAGWFLARVILPVQSGKEAWRIILRGFGIILLCAAAGSILGWGWGALRGPVPEASGWSSFVSTHGIMDIPRFVRVAYIHNASYAGGFLGIILAVGYAHRMMNKVVEQQLGQHRMPKRSP